MSRQQLRIGEVASLVGVTPKTIRHYHEVGLLPEPARSETGYRLYNVDDLVRLRRIIKLKSFGLSLQQIQQIFEAEDPDTALFDALQHLQAELRHEVAQLEERLARIAHFLADPGTLQSVSSSKEVKGKIHQHMEERLYPVLEDIDASQLVQDEAILKELESYDWPLAHQKRLQDNIDVVAESTELREFLRSVMQEFTKIEELSADAPEIVNAAWKIAQSEGGRAMSEWIATRDEVDDTYAQILSDTADSIAAEVYSPAQVRFMQVLREMLRLS